MCSVTGMSHGGAGMAPGALISAGIKLPCERICLTAAKYRRQDDGQARGLPVIQPRRPSRRCRLAT